MNAPNDLSDPFLQSLADEASDLPAQAAAAARQRATQRRHTRQQLALTGTVSLVCVVGSLLISPHEKPPTADVKPIAHDRAPEPTPSFPTTTPDKTASDGRGGLQLVEMPLPTGLDEEQVRFVKAVNDMPLLLVRDASGKVTRIHAIER